MKMSEEKRKGFKESMEYSFSFMEDGKKAAMRNIEMITKEHAAGGMSYEDQLELLEFNQDLVYEDKVNDEIEQFFVRKNEEEKRLWKVYPDRGLYCDSPEQAEVFLKMSFEEWLEAIRKEDLIKDILEN